MFVSDVLSRLLAPVSLRKVPKGCVYLGSPRVGMKLRTLWQLSFLLLLSPVLPPP